jgi:hypothetical protein
MVSVAWADWPAHLSYILFSLLKIFGHQPPPDEVEKATHKAPLLLFQMDPWRSGGTGALITGLTNLEVARYLLERGLPSMDGAVFLDAGDRPVKHLRR